MRRYKDDPVAIENAMENIEYSIRDKEGNLIILDSVHHG